MKPMFFTLAILFILFVTFAIRDALGKSKTGCGEFLNSIRLCGEGLGTWVAILFLEICLTFCAFLYYVQQALVWPSQRFHVARVLVLLIEKIVVFIHGSLERRK